MSSGWSCRSGLMSPTTAPGSIFGGAVIVTSETVLPDLGGGGAGAAQAMVAAGVAARLTPAQRIARKVRFRGLRFTRRSSAREAARGSPGPLKLMAEEVAVEPGQKRAPLLRGDCPA